MGKVVKNVFLTILIILFVISLSASLIIYKIDSNLLEKESLTKKAMAAIEKQNGNTLLEEVKGVCRQNAGENANLVCNNLTESEANQILTEMIDYGYNQFDIESKHQLARSYFNISMIIAIISLIIILLINIKSIKSFFAWIGYGLIVSGIIYIITMNFGLQFAKKAMNTQIDQVTTLLKNIIDIPYMKEGLAIIVLGIICLIIWLIARHYSDKED
jgi:hypothetical protein